jgi:ABC-type lipoprotein export system ATPase subunit
MTGTASAPLIAISDLRKTYRMGDSEVHALDGVSLTIAQGDFVAIIGASGSGKSTLMNMIGGLDQPDSGSIAIAGQEISRMSGAQLARFRNETIGFVFQQFQLLPRQTALRNVMLPMLYSRQAVDPKAREARARECLALVGLEERAGHRPTQLSGGQQQRVAIARALASRPRILLADEPTGALDSRNSEAIMQLFGDLNRAGITLIVITHEDEVAAWAHRVITFRDGRILSDTRNRETPR